MEHKHRDYKRAAVNYYLQHKSYRKTCEIFVCEKSSLQRWVERHRDTGNVRRDPYDMTHRGSKLTVEMKEMLRTELRKKATLTLFDLVQMIKDKYGVEVHHTTIYRAVHDLKFTRKRVRSRYYPEKKVEHEQDHLKAFYNKVQRYDMDKLISIDETSIYLNMHPSYGRNYKGRRVVIKTHNYPYKRFNCLFAIKAGRIVGYEIYKDITGVKTEEFTAFIDKFVRNRYPRHLILMDNAAFHRSNIVHQHIQDMGCAYLHTIPYHPETNPIEEFFSQLKHYIKAVSPQSYDEVVEVVNRIVRERITAQHLTNYFRHMLSRGKKYES